MAGIKGMACIPGTSWHRLRELYGNEKIDYYNLLDTGYEQAKADGTLHEVAEQEIRYTLPRPNSEGKTIVVEFTPNRRRKKNPEWIWCLSAIYTQTEPTTKKKGKKETRSDKSGEELAADKGEPQVKANGKRTKRNNPADRPAAETTQPAAVKKAAEQPKKENRRSTQQAPEPPAPQRRETAAGTPLLRTRQLKSPPQLKGRALPLVTEQAKPYIAAPAAKRPRQDKAAPPAPAATPAEEYDPNRALRQFAWLGAEVDFYKGLGAMMMSEPWYFSTDENNTGLASYINYTFYRLQTEDKIVRSIDGEYTAFNTGLVDNRDNEIYALFARTQEYRQEWMYKAFCIRGTGDGKILSEKFATFPEKAEYALDPRLLEIQRDTEIDVDFRHIVIANAGRLPEEMLVDESDHETKSPLKNILEQRRRLAAQGDREGIEKLEHKLGGLVAAAEDFQNRLLDRLEEHIKVARNRVDQNPAIAIPVYYPGKNTMSVILPLYRFREDDIAYGALVVGITPAGNYQAHTLLTPRMAYVDARIVRPIDSLWLAKAYTASVGRNW